MTKPTYPLCECPHAGYECCGGVGPAVFSVVRSGKKLKLCTRCDIEEDKNRKVLPWVEKAPASLFINFDPLGALSLALYIGESKPKKK